MLNEIVNVDTDVLVIGGGIAGCMAAISARESGASVIMLEKGNTLRSGGAGTGIDHCWAYIPQLHQKEMSLDDLLDDHTSFAGGMVDRSLIRVVAENSFRRVLDLERFGVNMRNSDNQFRLQKKIHRCPTFIHFADRDIKIKLTRAVENSGTVIVNRIMATDLLVEDGRMAGVLAFSTREGKWHVYKSKTVILATGGVNRLYRSPSGIPFNICHTPSWSGDGHAMAFKAGARLLNMEMAVYGTGPKNFHRAGRGTYVPSNLSDGLGKSLKEYEPNQEGPISEGAGLFIKVLEKGNGPIYMDCTGNKPEQNEYIKWALNSEGNSAFLNYLDENGMDLNTDKIEFTFYEPRMGGQQGIEINDRAETSLPGLFAAGLVMGGAQRSVMPGALVMGWRAGENAARLARELPVVKTGDQAEDTIAGRVKLAGDFCSRTNGSSWQDAQLALQNIMDSYAGRIKSASMLEVGYNNLMQLKEQAAAEIKAANPHELYRAMEIMSLMEVGEMLITSAYARKESRGLNFYRADYPQKDNDWLKFITLKKEKDKTIVGVRPVNLNK